MLQANDKHQHSRNPEGGKDDWASVVSGLVDTLGGSASGSPSSTLPADKRSRLSMWGHKTSSDPNHTGGCCSETFTQTGEDVGWGKAFSVYYKVLPPPTTPVVSTVRTRLADLRSDTKLDDAYWMAECNKIPSDAIDIVVTMDKVADHFKPVQGSSFCQMLTSVDKHLWSRDGIVWYQPEYYPASLRRIGETDEKIQSSVYWNGGSAENWPRKIDPNDRRAVLSVWGSNVIGYTGGGCCSSAYENEAVVPNQKFAVEYTHVQVVESDVKINVGPTLNAGSTFWREHCKDVPEDAVFAKMDCDGVVDYFKPTEGYSFCEMLTSVNKHQWSATGQGDSWTTPTYISGTYLGGSNSYWPRRSGREGDDRRYLNFWGNENNQGGYCAPSYTSSSVAWNNPFTMTFHVEHSTTTKTSTTTTSTTATTVTATISTNTDTSTTTTAATATTATTIVGGMVDPSTDGAPVGGSNANITADGSQSELSNAAVGGIVVGVLAILIVFGAVILSACNKNQLQQTQLLDQTTVDMMLNPMHNHTPTSLPAASAPTGLTANGATYTVPFLQSSAEQTSLYDSGVVPGSAEHSGLYQMPDPLATNVEPDSMI